MWNYRHSTRVLTYQKFISKTKKYPPDVDVIFLWIALAFRKLPKEYQSPSRFFTRIDREVAAKSVGRIRRALEL